MPHLEISNPEWVIEQPEEVSTAEATERLIAHLRA